MVPLEISDILGRPIKRGFAEDAVVNGLLESMEDD
jgi:hypothetical protein